MSAGENQLYSVFFLHPEYPFFRGKILVAENHSHFSGGEWGDGDADQIIKTIRIKSRHLQ